MPYRILSLLDEAMITGYFTATGITDKDEQASVRQTLENGFLKLEREFRSQFSEAQQNTPEWRKQMRMIKRDYLPRREARILHEDENAVFKTISKLPELKNPWNIRAAEKARTHILYHQKMLGYANAIIFNLPEELKSRPEEALPQDTVRSDALYAMMYSLFSETNFVSDEALSLSERAIKRHLEREKENFQALLDDPQAFLNKIATMVKDETLPPELPETDLHKDERDEIERRKKEREQNQKDEGAELDELEESNQQHEGEEEEKQEQEDPNAPKKAKRSMGENDQEGESQREEKDDFNQGDPNLDYTDGKKPPPYKVYTKDYDEIIRADELVEADERERLYSLLQSRCPEKPQGWREPNISRSLSTRMETTFERRQDEGPHFDPTALTQIVTSERKGVSAPQDIRMRWKEVTEPDTCVTLLLDNSGSMRGSPIAYVAQFAEIFGSMLDKRGIPFEILGFTTKAWKGGQSRQDWHYDNKPANPGRLNDLRHIIYKDMKMPWSRERSNLGIMMKEHFLRENIDGEALEWAYRRSMQTHYRRKIIIPLLDGAPIDDSSVSENHPQILQQHLHDVIAKIEKAGHAELHAIGIGNYSTKHYFRNSYAMAHTENPYIAAGEILDSIASYAPGQEHRLKSRLRLQRARDAEAGHAYGIGPDRIKPK